MKVICEHFRHECQEDLCRHASLHDSGDEDARCNGYECVSIGKNFSCIPIEGKQVTYLTRKGEVICIEDVD